MQVIINDTSKFKCLRSFDKFDNTDILEINIVMFLKHLVLTKEMSQEIFEFIKPVGSIRPRNYGIPIIHKKTIPMRSILSMMNSPQHKVAKFLSCQLKLMVCFGFKKINKDILTTRGEIMNLFFQELILQTKFRSKTSSVLK